MEKDEHKRSGKSQPNSGRKSQRKQTQTEQPQAQQRSKPKQRNRKTNKKDYFPLIDSNEPYFVQLREKMRKDDEEYKQCLKRIKSMKQEDKNLILADLCARLPYGVMVHDEMLHCDGKLVVIDVFTNQIVIVTKERRQITNISSIDNIRPYLRPMSSISEDEEEQLFQYSEKYWDNAVDNQIQSALDKSIKENKALEYIAMTKSLEWLNSHHLDYRGLIEMGLAIEITDENNPYK